MHCNRKYNKETDYFAKLAHYFEEERIWIDMFPPRIIQMAYKIISRYKFVKCVFLYHGIGWWSSVEVITWPPKPLACPAK